MIRGLSKKIYFSGLAITGIYGGYRGLVRDDCPWDSKYVKVIDRTANMIVYSAFYSFAYITIPIWIIPYSVEYYLQKRA